MAYVLLPALGQSASLSERIQRTRAQIEDKRQREGVLSQHIEGYNTRIEALQGDIRGLLERQKRIQQDLDEKRAILLEARDRLERARDRLARLRRDQRRAETALAARLVELYKADEPDALTVVLESDGFADLLERTEFLERVAEQDADIIGRVRRLKVKAERQEQELTALERRAENAANEILARRNELAAARGRLTRSRGEIQHVRDARRGALDQVRSSRVRLEGDLRELEAANRQVTGQLQNLGGGNRSAGPIRRGSGSLIWPVNGPVVSPFGPRWGRLHAGIDIAVPAGTPIRAADSGTVVLMGWVGGYGNYTCVGHGSSLSTCYAHQSRYATSRGAHVSQGQVIGYVGCTGHCFGDHLHFETRVGGSPVNPMGYL